MSQSNLKCALECHAAWSMFKPPQETPEFQDIYMALYKGAKAQSVAKLYNTSYAHIQSIQRMFMLGTDQARVRVRNHILALTKFQGFHISDNLLCKAFNCDHETLDFYKQIANKWRKYYLILDLRDARV